MVRGAAAGNANLTGPDYVELAADADAGVRAAVAANPGAGTAALEHLSGDADPAIVEIVAGNPNAPLPFLGRRRVGDLAPWRGPGVHPPVAARRRRAGRGPGPTGRRRR